MIVKEEFLSKLRRYFSLNLYEVRVWAALLSRGVSTAGELSDIADVPRSRSYDILESLEKKGFVVMKLGKPIKYIAVPPSEVLERVKKNVLTDAEEKAEHLEKLKETDVIKELNTLHSQGIELIEPTELSGVLRGRRNLYAHLESTLKNAENSISMMTTSQGFLRKIEGFKPLFEKLKKKGVKIRIAAPISKESKKLLKSVNHLAEVKHTDLNGRFCLVDNKELVFMILDDKEVHPTNDLGVWVNTPFFTNAVSSMFDAAWKDMKKI